MSMSTGNYDQIISFISLGYVPDGHGGTIPDRSTLLTTYAAVKQLTSARDVEELQQVLNGAYLINIKYRDDFTPTKGMLINFLDEDFTINRIILIPERHKRQWQITAVRADNSDRSVT